ncbi:hypothetical protein [Caballeronia sp. DA-9]|uniref:hypothetical protein n=1 Tax=Caballeronia sp. DA-9 TaxID=3436237 RepID=UPI003F66B0F4
MTIALQLRHPAPGLLLHSDQGSSYASDEYEALLKEHRLIFNKSSKGNCWNNTVTEIFFLSLRMERVWQCQYASHSEVRHQPVHRRFLQSRASVLGFGLFVARGLKARLTVEEPSACRNNSTTTRNAKLRMSTQRSFQQFAASLF